MVLCHHESCGCEEKVWLPTNGNQESDVDLHPWCVHCGVVKNISDDRPHKLGYWMNVLSRVVRRFSLTQCQKRLVAKELESYGCLDDCYGITGSAQAEVFVKTLTKYCGFKLNTNAIYSFIY